MIDTLIIMASMTWALNCTAVIRLVTGSVKRWRFEVGPERNNEDSRGKN